MPRSITATGIFGCAAIVVVPVPPRGMLKAKWQSVASASSLSSRMFGSAIRRRPSDNFGDSIAVMNTSLESNTRSTAPAFGNKATGASPRVDSRADSATYGTTVPEANWPRPPAPRRGGKKTSSRCADLLLMELPTSDFSSPKHGHCLLALTWNCAFYQCFHARDRSIQLHFTSDEEETRRSGYLGIGYQRALRAEPRPNFSSVVEI